MGRRTRPRDSPATHAIATTTAGILNGKACVGATLDPICHETSWRRISFGTSPSPNTGRSEQGGGSSAEPEPLALNTLPRAPEPQGRHRALKLDSFQILDSVALCRRARGGPREAVARRSARGRSARHSEWLPSGCPCEPAQRSRRCPAAPERPGTRAYVELFPRRTIDDH